MIDLDELEVRMRDATPSRTPVVGNSNGEIPCVMIAVAMVRELIGELRERRAIVVDALYGEIDQLRAALVEALEFACDDQRRPSEARIAALRRLLG